MNLLNKLPNSVKTRIVITSVPFVFEGCETLIYNHPADQWIVDKVVPESLLSKSIRDKQARERGEGKKNNKEDCIQVTIPQGYIVPLCKDKKVYYQGRKSFLWDINPPNIELSFPKKPGLYKRRNSFMVKIKDLDMFRE